MENLPDSQNNLTLKPGAAATVVKMPLLGGSARKKLSDISNGQLRTAPASPCNDENIKPLPSTSKDFIEKLQKENTALLKHLAEKSKIVDQTTVELHKLKLNLQKVNQQNFQIRQQNSHLAQTNSHMLAELNLGKDRLKKIQHEFGCTVGALKAKVLLLEEKLKMPHQSSTQEDITKCKGMPEASKHVTVDKPCNPNKRRPSRVSSACKSVTTQQTSTEEKDHKKRNCMRRQSSSFKTVEPPPTEDLFEIEDVKFPAHPLVNESTPDVSLITSDSSVCISSPEVKPVKEEKEKKTDCQPQQMRRSSVGRPMRKAAEKVSSYKEMPVNVKLRRAE